MAVFRNEGARMRLVTARRVTDAWLESVTDGVPLDPSFASAQSVLAGEIVQFADVRAIKGRFGATARQLSSGSIRACHFVPIMRDGQIWGHLGLGRCSPSPIDTVTMAYLRALCAAFLLHLDDRRWEGGERGRQLSVPG
jgi:GAF domain-containing protein